MLGHLKVGECFVLDDSIIWNVGTECSNMKCDCFPDIRNSCVELLKTET
jgi:hypothetical protein